MENRRLFTRILFSIKATLTVEDIDYDVSIHDLSLNGALISRSPNQVPLKGKLGILAFSLNDSESTVTQHVAVVHEEEHEIGLQCNAIDLESISLLRRLVELNLGDDEQLNRELSQLSRCES